MREILFRGKRKDNGEWVYGGFTLDAIDCPRITVKDGNGLLFHEVVPETVGQYAGIADKNGVKIFEGDVIRYPNSFLGHYILESITYEKGAFHAGWEVLSRILNLNELEVIGNIHDNPELLPDKRSV